MAAFVVIGGPVVLQWGLPGLATATVMAGLMLLLLGSTNLGRWLQFVPHPVIVGLSSGLALCLIASQVGSALGLESTLAAGTMIQSFRALMVNWDTRSLAALAMATATALSYQYIPKRWPAIPGGLLAISACGLANALLPTPLAKFPGMCSTRVPPRSGSAPLP